MKTDNVIELRPSLNRESEIEMFFHCALCLEELPEGKREGEREGELGPHREVPGM